MPRGRPFQTGNRLAALGDHSTPRAFKRELTVAVHETDGDATKMRRIVVALIARAIAGDVLAIREIMDRVDGRVPLANPSLDEPPEDPITVIERVIDSPGETSV